jgi:hypothetical protein
MCNHVSEIPVLGIHSAAADHATCGRWHRVACDFHSCHDAMKTALLLQVFRQLAEQRTLELCYSATAKTGNGRVMATDLLRPSTFISSFAAREFHFNQHPLFIRSCRA